jgi:hypothetical protein
MRVDPAFLTRQDNLAAHFGKMPAANRSGTAMTGPDSLDSHPVPGHSRLGFLDTFVRRPNMGRRRDLAQPRCDRGSGLAALKSAS